MLGLMSGSAVCGMLGLLWLFGTHASIWVTVSVKPFGAFLLVISCLLYDQLRRETNKIGKYKHLKK